MGPVTVITTAEGLIKAVGLMAIVGAKPTPTLTNDVQGTALSTTIQMNVSSTLMIVLTTITATIAMININPQDRDMMTLTVAAIDYMTAALFSLTHQDLKTVMQNKNQ